MARISWHRRLIALAGALAFTAAHSATVVMAFGEKIAPYCFPETNSGIELDVIGEALAVRGHQLKPVYVPLARVPFEFKYHKVDAAMTDLGEDMRPFGGFYGDPAVVYDNVLITLKHRNLHITQPEDLDGLTVLSFQGAVKRYPTWLNAVNQHGQYFEQANQELQVLTLDKQRYDVVLSDRYIYRYHANQIEHQTGVALQPVTEHAFVKINPKDYRPVFHDKAIYDKYLQK